jgi:gluconokinase
MVLAIDLGTSSVRSALLDAAAEIVPGSMASRRYRVAHSVSHAAELDPRTLLRATQHCLRRTRACLTTEKLPAIAGSGFWHSLLGLDQSGEPLTPIYTWADGRAEKDAARLRQQFSERALQRRTGCMLRASFWPAKLLWLRRTEPQLFRRIARWVSPAEWIFEKLFGVIGCSHSMASGTGLYNLARRDWDPKLLEHCRLTKGQLNSLGTEFECNGTAIFPAIGDGAAGNLGSGATRPGWVAINVGTSAAARTVPKPGTSLPFGLFQFVIDETRNLLGGAVSNAGSLRAWALRTLRLPNDKQKIESLLHTRIESTNPLTILPFWIAERAPTWPEHLTGTITGLSQATTAIDLFAAALASVCYRLADILEELERATGPAKKIIVAGGIQQSPAWLHLLANSLGRDLFLAPEQEASLRGAAVYALNHRGVKVPQPDNFKFIPHDPAKSSESRTGRARQRAFEELIAKHRLGRL